MNNSAKNSARESYCETLNSRDSENVIPAEYLKSLTSQKLVPSKICCCNLFDKIDIPLAVLVDNSFSMFSYRSISRRYHAYKDVWHLIMNDVSLICEPEETNEYDWNAVSIIFEACILRKVVGHVPFKWISKIGVNWLPNSCRYQIIVFA